jgi:hypothetical protein
MVDGSAGSVECQDDGISLMNVMLDECNILMEKKVL